MASLVKQMGGEWAALAPHLEFINCFESRWSFLLRSLYAKLAAGGSILIDRRSPEPPGGKKTMSIEM